MTYLVITKETFGGDWGKGKTIEDAMNNAQKQSGKRKKPNNYVVIESEDSSIYMDETGCIVHRFGTQYKTIMKVKDGKVVKT